MKYFQVFQPKVFLRRNFRAAQNYKQNYFLLTQLPSQQEAFTSSIDGKHFVTSLSSKSFKYDVTVGPSTLSGDSWEKFCSDTKLLQGLGVASRLPSNWSSLVTRGALESMLMLGRVWFWLMGTALLLLLQFMLATEALLLGNMVSLLCSKKKSSLLGMLLLGRL